MRDEELIAFIRTPPNSAIERAAADRIEALTARAEKAEAALKEAEDKLAQATWLLTEAAVQLEEGKIKTRRNRAAIIWNLLDEMKADDAP
jgi:Tfp pilus assembly protein PilX